MKFFLLFFVGAVGLVGLFYWCVAFNKGLKYLISVWMWKSQHYFTRKSQHTILGQNWDHQFVHDLYIISVGLTPMQTLAVLIWDIQIAEKGSSKTIYLLSMCFPVENLLPLKLEKAPKVQILLRKPPLELLLGFEGSNHCAQSTPGCYKLLWFSMSSRSIGEAPSGGPLAHETAAVSHGKYRYRMISTCFALFLLDW